MGRSKKGPEVEIAVYDDLVSDIDAGTCLKEIGISGTVNFRKKIHECYECGGSIIIPLTVLGARTGPLLWDCGECGHMHLRFTPRYTEQLLRKASQLWSNPNDWGPRLDEYFN